MLGRLAFIGVAQNAGFKLREIREMLSSIDDGEDMAESVRALSRRKLPEVEAAIERARSMQSWLAAASECNCSTAAECTLFDEPARGGALELVHVEAAGCRREALPS